jgi:hypothetical protein
MRRVIVESPYAGDVDRNVEYARQCVRDCVLRDEAPIASHLLFTQPGILRDEIAEERQLGITAGLAWLAVAEAVVFYIDYGMSAGMRDAMHAAERAKVTIEIRTLKRSDNREMKSERFPDEIGKLQASAPSPVDGKR